MTWKNILKLDIEGLKRSYPSLKGLPDEAIKEFDRRLSPMMGANRLIDELKQKYGVSQRAAIGRFVKEDIIKRKKKPFKGYNKKIHARTGGLSAKGRAKFKREQGSNLKPPVTTKPSKLKRGSKAAKRRKSFCARSRGFKRADGTYSEKAKAARRRWNC